MTLALIGTLILSIGSLSQIFHLVKVKDSTGVSMVLMTCLVTGYALLSIQSLMDESMGFRVSSIGSLVVLIAQTVLVIRYRRK